jgi:hypothetical protein
MARQYMTKEVTITTIKSGTIKLNKEGQPEVISKEDIIELGTISQAKANKLVYKKYGVGTTIYSMETETKMYRMKVEDFIKIAELVTDDTPKEDLDFDSENEDDNEDSETTNQSENDRNEIQKKGKITIIPKEEVNT